MCMQLNLVSAQQISSEEASGSQGTYMAESEPGPTPKTLAPLHPTAPLMALHCEKVIEAVGPPAEGAAHG